MTDTTNAIGAPYLGGAYPQGDANTIMPDVWGYLLVKYNLKTVLDLGCGFGHAIQWFSRQGLCDVLGIDGWDEAIKGNLMPTMVRQHDFTKGPAPLIEFEWPRSGSIDLVWSSEFLEHVDEEFLPNIMETMRLGRYVCVTHAEPDQPGFHHVNCKETGYWIEKFAECGMIHVPEETAVLRSTDRWHAGWGRRTLTFFSRGDL